MLSTQNRYVCLLCVGIIVLYFVFMRFTTSKSDTSSQFTANTANTANTIEHYQNDALLTPKTYHPKYLHDWVPAPTVPESPRMPGELGKAVILPAELEAESKERFTEHEFNIVVSDMISTNRSLADVRDPECLKIKYAPKLPTTSIIIIFHNEAWSTLVRSLWSIINRSPKDLVKEIILVDDKSTFDYLGQQLDDYVETLPIPVKIIRMEDRLGLIKARLRGAEVSRVKKRMLISDD
ncbi:Polypeptide N-acetylgalactosaminyltransferase 5 [Pseudolycoriella hygida]|uniref:Polypeptide N-acetylgalactosaminyltransferase 5 n=1 Tax=Pseudolycoriella hygida TaxID=35572 RepID=A0A9Q0NAC3_9DIPT|nr:Polypeptide N-acetylgalactosaminyltransferase 5 [Pseudolycoriella hygida]